MGESEIIELIRARDERGAEELLRHFGALLRYVIAPLPPGERALIYRKYYYRQPTSQIASELGLSPRAVEGRLYRIKKRLGAALGGERNG